MKFHFIDACSQNRRGLLGRRGEQIALGLLIALVGLISVIWILQDTRPQPGADPNHYLIKTLEFADSLATGGSALRWQSIDGMSIGGGRPPLYQLLAVPFIYLFGRSEDAVLAVNVVFTAILLLATYGIGRLAKNGKAGLLAAFLVATYPPIINSSKLFLPHSATPACVALSVWLLLLLLKTRSVRVAWIFGLSVAFGMWIQFQFLYLLPALAIVGLYMLFFQTDPRRPSSLRGTPRWLLAKLGDPFALRGLLPAALIAAALTAAWYVPHSQAILGLRQGVAVDFAGVTEGFGGVPHTVWWYALTAPRAISGVFAALVAIGLVLAVLRPRPGLSLLAITFVITYFCVSLSAQVFGWIYFAAVLPVAAALTAVWIVDLGTVEAAWARWLSAALAMVCIIVAAFNFSLVTWGLEPWGWPIAIALGAPLDPPFCLDWRMHVAYCPNPAQDQDWHVSDILRTIVEDDECQARECDLAVVPYREDFNLEIVNWHLLRDFPQAHQRIQTTNPGGWRGQPGDGEWVTSDYLVYIPELRPRSYGAETTLAITLFLESPSPAFADTHREVAAFSLPWGWTAKLTKSTEPLDMDATLRLYEEALASVPSDVALYEKLGYLYLRIGDEARAEELFRQAIQVDPALGSPHLALGTLYQSQGLEAQAVAAFQEAIEKQPTEPKTYRQLADLWLARGDPQEAVGVYALAIRNNPGLIWPYLELGALHVWSNQLAEARDLFQEAARLEPWNQTVRANLQALHWSLASGLGVARAYTDQTPLTWWQGEAWVKPYPYNQDVLVGRSVLSAAGLSRPDQIHLHPFGADQDTYVDLDVQDCGYAALQIGYGLADQIAGLSNGVRYSLRARVEGESPHTLWDATVTDNVWRSQTVSLVPYWGQDVTLQLAVDPLGDESYDWLQTTVRLFPAAQAWDLATNLASVQVAALDTPLAWDGARAWIDADGRPLVTLSQAPVQGSAQGNQVQFHPFGSHQDTTITFLMEDNPYSVLQTAYALADEAAGQSDGVGYAILLSTDEGRTYKNLFEREVLSNAWDSAMLDLSGYLDRDLTFKLVSASQDNDTYDWLQIKMSFIEMGDYVGNRGE